MVESTQQTNKNKVTLLFVRHGQVLAPKYRTPDNSMNPPLSLKGHERARKLTEDCLTPILNEVREKGG